MTTTQLLATVGVALTVLLLACSSDTDREPVTLEQYFARVQELHEEQQLNSEAVGAQLAPQFSGAASLDDALEVMQEVLPQFLPEFRSLIEETRVGLEVLTPPSGVQVEHEELLALYDDFIDLIDEAADQLERGEAGAEVLQTFLGERSGTALGVRFTALANRLASIAATNGIEAELNSGPLVADSGGSTGRGGQPTVIGVETASPGLTGIVEIDTVFDAVTLASYYSDFSALEALVRFTTTGCTEQLGVGGPPKCLVAESEEEGTVVEVFPFSVCEGEYVRRGDDVARLLQDLAAPGGEPGLVERAYAVYDLRGVQAGAPYWPEGDFAVLFSMRQGDERWGTMVRVGDGGVVRVDFGCGRTPPAEMVLPGATELLSPPASR